MPDAEEPNARRAAERPGTAFSAGGDDGSAAVPADGAGVSPHGNGGGPGAATQFRAALLGALFGLLAGAVAAFAPLGLYFLLFGLASGGAGVGWVVSLLMVCALIAALVVGWAKAFRSLRGVPADVLRSAAWATAVVGCVTAVAGQAVLLANPLEDHGMLLAVAAAATSATAVTALCTVRRGGRPRGSNTAIWLVVGVLVLAIGGLVASVPLIETVAARAEITGDIDDFGGDIAIVDGGDWRPTGLSYSGDPGEKTLDIGYENADGDRATLRHIPRERWGAEGTADGHFMCPLRGFTCAEKESGDGFRLLVKKEGRLYSTQLTLGDGSGVSIDAEPDYSKPEGEQVSPRVVGELSEYTRQATPKDREHLVDALMREREKEERERRQEREARS